ncbi:MAG: hypothetical protein CMD99_07085 [Gammaproteobacteria bacterium]|nr:hypothetical protein [Gammaproteobacteria bacterium]
MLNPSSSPDQNVARQSALQKFSKKEQFRKQYMFAHLGTEEKFRKTSAGPSLALTKPYNSALKRSKRKNK